MYQQLDTSDVCSIMPAKTAQLQIRVTPAQKAALKGAIPPAWTRDIASLDTPYFAHPYGVSAPIY